MKTLSLVLASLTCLCLARAARADITPEKRAEAQAEVDKAKADTCVKVQQFIAKYKDRCPEQAAEAAKVTCSAAEFKHINDLNTACLQAKPAKGATTPAKTDVTPPPAKTDVPSAGAPPTDKNACKATDADGTVIASATSEKSLDCRNQIKAAVMKAKCTEGVKKFKYNYQRGDLKPSTSTVYCK